MRFSRGAIALLAAVACVDETVDLGRGGPDGGVATPAADAGARDGAADDAPVDAGAPDAAPTPDLGGAEDAGGRDADVSPAGCSVEWSTVVTSTAHFGVQVDAFAAAQGALAVIWTEFDQNWAGTASLQFFSLGGAPLGPARGVAPGSRIVGLENRFLRGGPDGLEYFGVDGSAVGTVDPIPFIVAAAFFRDVIFGWAPVAGDLRVPAALLNQHNPFALLPSEFSADVQFAFAPFRLVVVEPDERGAEVGLFALGNVVSTSVARHRFERTAGGDPVPGLPTRLTAGAWNDLEQRFELLFEVRVANGRFFGAQRFFLDDDGLVEAPPLLDTFEEVTHGGLEGDVIVDARGRVVVAYVDDVTTLGAELVLVSDGIAERFELGPRLRSGPKLAPTPSGHAVVAPKHTRPGAPWENEIVLRCFDRLP